MEIEGNIVAPLGSVYVKIIKRSFLSLKPFHAEVLSSSIENIKTGDEIWFRNSSVVDYISENTAIVSNKIIVAIKAISQKDAIQKAIRVTKAFDEELSQRIEKENYEKATPERKKQIDEYNQLRDNLDRLMNKMKIEMSQEDNGNWPI